jgi:ferrous iron transport protein A
LIDTGLQESVPFLDFFGFKTHFQKSVDLATQSQDFSGREYTDQTSHSSPMDQHNQLREPARSPDTLTTLDQIPPPAKCRVVAVPARGPIRKRLLVMGFVPGTGVEVLRAAPLGDPVEYRVKGYCISLRREEAKLISVSLWEGEE